MLSTSFEFDMDILNGTPWHKHQNNWWMSFYQFICPLRYEEHRQLFSRTQLITVLGQEESVLNPPPVRKVPKCKDSRLTPQSDSDFNSFTICFDSKDNWLLMNYNWIELWYYIRTINHKKYYLYYCFYNLIKLICISTLFSLCCVTLCFQNIRLQILSQFLIQLHMLLLLCEK